MRMSVCIHIRVCVCVSVCIHTPVCTYMRAMHARDYKHVSKHTMYPLQFRDAEFGGYQGEQHTTSRHVDSTCWRKKLTSSPDFHPALTQNQCYHPVPGTLPFLTVNPTETRHRCCLSTPASCHPTGIPQLEMLKVRGKCH